jgi:D-beta-D-heptose 7-phosphate kinase/D-beta-D-heptose 1-phosphate adenosyltransferase
MSLFAPDRPAVHIPARAREVYDVTGAGDTVVGALTVAMAAGMEPADAAAFANLAAGIVVGKLGTSVATLDEIKAEVKSRRWK